MNKHLLAAIVLTLFQSPISAQERTYLGLTIGIADTTANHFFKLNPDVNRLIFRFHSETPVGLNIHSNRNLNEQTIESLDLAFPGDRYLVIKKYPSLVLPKRPNLQLHYITSLPKSKVKAGNNMLEITIKRDSIFQRFDFYVSDSINIESIGRSQSTAIFKGNRDKLRSAIENIYSGNVSDSSFLVIGTVDEKGHLGGLNLAYSTQTILNLKAISVIDKYAQSWQPAWLNGKNIKYKVKFFIQIVDSKVIDILIK